jgi:DNA-binding CsgD family transcriptional regulator
MGASLNRARSLRAAVDAASEALRLQDLDGTAEASLRDAVGASGLLVYHFDEQGRVGGAAGNLLPAMARYSLDLFLEDPVQHLLLTAVDLPRILETRAHLRLDDRCFHRSAAYADFYRPYEMERLIGVRLNGASYGTPGMCGILLTRSPRQPEWSAADRALLERALPAFDAAARRATRFAEREAQRSALAAVLPRAHAAHHLILDARGRLLWAAPGAEERLGGAGLAALPDALVAAARRLAAPQRNDEGHDCGRTPDAATFRVALGEGSPARHAELSLARTDGGERVVAVHLEDPPPSEAARAAGVTALGDRCGLTRAECDVLAVLARGASNREIAATLHVSVETVKTHVQRILAKLGVASRVQAALAANQGFATTPS